jgi:protein O-mannosyl-transferase
LKGRSAEALAHWRDGIELLPNYATALQQAAWVLATSPESSLRNGTEAVKLALRAAQLSGGNDPVILDTLAAAYAEEGRFTDAALTARKALTLAEKGNQRLLTEALKARIALYMARRAFRDMNAASVQP